LPGAKRGTRADARGPGAPRRRRAALVALVAAVIAAGIVGSVFLVRSGTGPGFGTLAGRWVRLDGGYVLEIRGVGADGKIDAVYLNPRPINVARAEATRDGAVVKIYVELRGPGYPGSTYTLSYDHRTDQLEGVYHQAALQQDFDVRFVRMK